MKKVSILFLTILVCNISWTQVKDSEDAHSEVFKKNTRFFKTPPIRDLLKSLNSPNTNHDDWIAPSHVKESTSTIEMSDYKHQSEDEIDPVLQVQDGWRSGQGMLQLSFLGQGGGVPPDPSGAAGYDYYVQAVNLSYRIYNKDGSPASSPFRLSTLWENSADRGDPIVMYDSYADRWFISQFQVEDATPGETHQILIAISETSDPLGSYYAYTFDFNSFTDYPKFGVWSNAYYMTANTRDDDCIAFEREKMLLGDSSAGLIKMEFPEITTYRFSNSGVAPISAEGSVAPEDNAAGYFFALQDDSWNSADTDGLKIFKSEIDWQNKTGSVVLHQDLPTAPFNARFSGPITNGTQNIEDLTQPGTTKKLGAFPMAIMYRAQYRRFEGYNSYIMCHTVDVDVNSSDNNYRAAIRWYEIRDNNDGVFYVHQQGTYAPDLINSRWMGSISMDAQGNMALAYSFVGPNDFAGIRYTGRFKDDPLGEMTVQEQIVVEGSGFQTGSSRYGDYSQMAMDPEDDMTFWFTGEYLGTNGITRTRIISFSSWNLVGQEEISKKPGIFKGYQISPETVRLEWSNINDQNLNIRIHNTAGGLLYTESVASNNGQKDVNVPAFAGGIYIVNLIGENTNITRKVYIGR